MEAYCPLRYVDVMLLPGAAISTLAPVLEKDERALELVVEATAMAPSYMAG